MTLPVRKIVGQALYGDNSAGSGSLRFSPEFIFAYSGSIVLPGSVIAQVDSSGNFEIVLATTDAEGYSPAGWVWKVEEVWPGGRTFFFELPTEDGSDVPYTGLIPAQSVANPYAAHTHLELGGFPVDGVAGDLVEFDGAAWRTTDQPTVYTLSFQTSGAALEPADGQMVWNAEEGTVDLGLNGVNGTFLHVGQDLVYRIENQTGAPIAKGQLVGLAGTVGASGKLLGKLFDAAVDPAKAVMGVASELIPAGGLGYVVSLGKVRKIDTDVVTWAEGDLLYAEPGVPGGLTNIPPQPPNAIVTVASLVTKSATVGEILMRPTFAPALTETQDVRVIEPITGQVLVYNAVAGVWENVTLTAASVGALSDTAQLNDLSDVATVGVQTGDVLAYDGVNWAPDGTRVASTDVASIEVLTETEYAAIVTPDPTVLYVVVEDPVP